MSRVVLVHGFTQTGASWAAIADGLADHEVVAPDQPGHGARAAAPADLVASADLLAPLGPAMFVGYSMGARVALHLALRHPAAVHGLVLLGGTAGIEDADERAARRASDEALADRIEAIGTSAFLDEWLAQPLFAGLPDDGRGARTSDAAGLAASLRLAGTGTQEPLWDRLGELQMPVLVVAGERDPKFRALGQRLVAGMGPNAELALVPDAGHAAHLERPDAFLAVLRAWLGTH
jgi:2-succinyl-6-hydroxy-2,4-cyclohexadiene-1-carboxylate synthase